MSQMPPPPPSEPAPMGGQPGSAASNSKTNVILCYLLWWITGIIFLFVGKNDPDVKFHAAQSTIFFGSISIIGFVLREISGFTGLALGAILALVSFAIWLFGVIVWIMCLVRANS